MNNKAFYNLTYGLFLLTAQENGRDNGCVVNTVMQVANEPARISVSVIRKNHTCDMILKTGKFGVSALTQETPFPVFQRFGMQSGRDVDKFDGFADIQRGEDGLLYLNKYANATFSATVTEQHDLGSHILFIGEVTDARVLDTQPSCSYGYYQSDIKPKPQKSEKKQWVCSVCGYVYEGETVPDDFICPLCNHGKEDFSLVTGGTPAVPSAAAPEAKEGATKWVCSVCGYVHEGDTPPEICPICKVDASKFTRN